MHVLPEHQQKIFDAKHHSSITCAGTSLGSTHQLIIWYDQCEVMWSDLVIMIASALAKHFVVLSMHCRCLGVSAAGCPSFDSILVVGLLLPCT